MILRKHDLDYDGLVRTLRRKHGKHGEGYWQRDCEKGDYGGLNYKGSTEIHGKCAFETHKYSTVDTFNINGLLIGSEISLAISGLFFQGWSFVGQSG